MKGLLTVTVAALLVAALVVPAPREAQNPAVGAGIPVDVTDLGPSSGNSGSVLLGASVVVVPGSKSLDRHPLARYETGSVSGAPHSLGPRSRPAAAADPRHKPAHRTAPVASKPVPAPVRAVLRAVTGLRMVRGIASWFCLPGRSACTVHYPASGMYAAAGPALRVGNWRGRVVTVTAGNASVSVTLSDFCGCPGRLIDLYGSVWQGLGIPLSAGLVEVTISW